MFLILFWMGLFVLFYDGFIWMQRFLVEPAERGAVLGGAVIYSNIIHYLFALYFLSLALMLIFSNGIIIYGALFKSGEGAYLMTLPLKSEQIFSYKFFETIIFSSWAFLFLGGPFLLAFGVSEQLRLSFYPLAIIAMFPFAVLNSSLGALITMIIVTLFPQSKKKLVMVGILVALLLVTAFSGPLIKLFDPVMTRSGEIWITNVLGKFRFSKAPILPSYWLTQLVLDAAAGDYRGSLFQLGYLTSTALVLYFAGANLAAWNLRENYSLVQGGRKKKLYTSRTFEKILYALFFFAEKEIRHFLVKDVKNFKRDSVQWTQFLIFFGLIGLYVLNLKNFGYHDRLPFWRNLVSFLNLTATALTLATFTSRFVFPLVSLEGRKFWVLGLAPLSRSKILWGKFLFAACGSILVSEILIIGSDLMLGTPFWQLLLHSGTMIIICVGLAGISVGLGARFPNFKEENPSKIVSGFGGTLNLIISMLFIFLVIMLEAVPGHIHLSSGGFGYAAYRRWTIAAMTAALFIGAAACVIPLRLGISSFKKVEF